MADFDGLRLELKRTLHSMMMEDTKAWLIRRLLRNKLATWDIYNFAVQQAGLKTSIKSLDWHTMSSALQAKLKDTKQTLERDEKEEVENGVYYFT